MNHEGMDSGPTQQRSAIDAKLDGLWAEYRAAMPDPEAGADFMPKLWKRIDARRVETTSIFRHMAQACVMAAVALTLIIAVLIPRIERRPVYSATYMDVLEAAHSSDATDFLATGDLSR